MNYIQDRPRWSTVAAALYVLWGILHLGLGVTMLAGGLRGGTSAGELAAESTMFFVCATVFGGQAMGVALAMNRLNSRRGFWLNLVPLGLVDVAFLIVIVAPGHVDLVGGLSGPLIWALAAASSVMAQRKEPVTT